VKRREFILASGAAAAVSLTAQAQQKAMPVIGLLGGPGPGAPWIAPFYQGLGETGYIEGQNLTIEYRNAEFHYDRLPALAADLVGRKVDVIFAMGTPYALAAKSATSTIPIVFTNVSDPVGSGLVASLARPGGNATGFSILALTLYPKRLELLSELVPHARVIALLVNPSNPITESTVNVVREAARTKGLQLLVLKAASESEIDAAFTTLVQLQAGGLLIDSDRFFGSRDEQVAALASHHAVPAIGESLRFARAGGLVSYGAVTTDVLHQAGIYTGRILKGEKSADLPVQQPTKFELVINLETAKALGLTVPQSLLTLADKLIE
jgi:putative ABC transport system substrate-binding protein